MDAGLIYFGSVGLTGLVVGLYAIFADSTVEIEPDDVPRILMPRRSRPVYQRCECSDVRRVRVQRHVSYK